ncbi:MAG: hypothetical protein WA919_08820 [Coleofasciculaceae cyanobacterium]
MAKITISNLKPNGYELFSDSESYMMDLSENELNATNGGLFWTVATVFTPTIVQLSIRSVVQTVR